MNWKVIVMRYFHTVIVLAGYFAAFLVIGFVFDYFASYFGFGFIDTGCACAPKVIP